MERLPDLFERLQHKAAATGLVTIAGEGSRSLLASRRAQWRMLTEGALVWAPVGEHGWRAATITELGKNRGERTVVHLSFETGARARALPASCSGESRS
jgi:hypothetical protein